METRFHYSFPVKDLKSTQSFYEDLLNCSIGRTGKNWVDIDFFGHQLTAVVDPNAVIQLPFYKRNEQAPYPKQHFGVVLPWSDWHDLKQRFDEQNVRYLIEPQTMFEGEIGEQKTMFLKDPNDYAIEFKAFEDPDRIFMPLLEME